jgi:hypothetical protein
VAVTPAVPTHGAGYWRLIKGVWYAEGEPPFAGMFHIMADALDESGELRAGVAFRVTSLDGSAVFATIETSPKPTPEYWANFPMYNKAPAYRIVPADAGSGDAVTNLGLGTIEDPWRTSHTSYGFVWQWTLAPAATETPTSTPTPTETPVMEGVRP